MSRSRWFAAAFRGAVWGGWLGWMPLAMAAVPTAEDLGLDDQIVDVWETADGLPQSSVTAITQTRDGYLWLGTEGGLACFDGNRFQVFNSQNTPELRSNRITALSAEAGGGLWIGTAEGGACHLFQGKFESFGTAQGLPDDDVRAFGFGADSRVWIGTAKGPVVWQNGKVVNPAEGSDGVSGPVVSICGAGTDALWLLEQGGLYQTSGSGVKRLPPALEMPAPDDAWQGLAMGQGGSPWMFGSSLARISVAGRSGIIQEPELAAGDRITALCERSDGEVWFGTRKGELRRFGRQEARPREIAAGAVRPGVRCIFEDRELNLWIGLEDGGLVRIKPKRVRTFGIRDGLPGEHVTGLCEDGKIGFWVACHAGGIAHWTGGDFSKFTANGALPADCIVWSLLRTRDGSVWIGTEGAGLLRWKDEHLEHFGPAEGMTESAVLAMTETAGVTLWLGGKDGKLLRRVAGGFTSYGPSEGFTGGSISVLADDHKGGVWIGTDGQGLYHFADWKFTRFTRADGLADDHVRSLLVDTGGVLWIGTSGGLTRLKDGVFASFTTRDGLWDNVISQVLPDTLDPVAESGDMWFGSNRGIFRIRKTAFDDVLTGKSPKMEPVVYGRSEGMDCLECSGGFSPAGLALSLTENPATKTGLQWFSTLRGLVACDVFPLTGRARGISADHLAFTSAVLHLGAEDTRLDLGDVVAGGNGFGTPPGRAAGIHAVKGTLSAGALTSNYRDQATRAADRYHRTSLPLVDGVFIPDGGVVPGRETVISSTGLKAEFPATTGEAWGLIKSGWNPAGVDLFNPSEMRALGVPMVWTSGNMGITFDLDAVRQATGKSISRFSAQVCNLHIGPASFQILLDGRLAAKRSGLVHNYGRFQRGIVPVDIPVPPEVRFLTLVSTDDKDEIGAFNRQAPVVSIEEVTADGVVQKPSARPDAGVVPSSLHPVAAALELAPGAGRLDFRYAAPSLVAPEKVRFRYRLEPLEANWVEAGDRRTANYARLSPGAYRFLVTACNNDGVWSPQGAALTITLRPHFWQTWWFMPLWIMCLAVAIVAATAFASGVRHRRHVRQLERLNALAVERARIARDIHDDLGAGLTQVALLSDLVRGDLAEPERAKVHLDQVFTVARRLARAVDEIVWAINPKNDALEFSFSYICKVSQDFLRAAGISCRLDLPESLPPGSLSSAQRHQLYLAVLESLNNVVKHAAASEVRLRFLISAADLTVEIHDNGCGFVFPPEGSPSVRHGLEGMAARMAEVGGKLEVTSQPGHGTVIRLRLPLEGRESHP